MFYYCTALFVHTFHTLDVFHLNVPDNNNDVTKPMLVMTRVGVLHFTRQYKDTLQRRLMIFMSFCFKFISVYAHQ